VSVTTSGTWTLGDHTVRRIGFGCMRLSGAGAFDGEPARDPDSSIRVLRRAVELGVDHLDTSNFYFHANAPTGPVRANELIRRALAPYDDHLTIVTKVGPRRSRDGEFLPFAKPEQLRAEVEQNLVELGLETLDVVNLRMLGPRSLTDHVGALVDLHEAGLLRHIGVSAVTSEQLEEARAVSDVVCVQNRYAVDARHPASDTLVERCGELGIAFVGYFAIAGERKEGAADGSEEVDAVVREVAQRHGATPAQVRIAWTLAQGPHVLAIPGTGRVSHLEENLAAGDLLLTADDLSHLDATRL
jgi:aryl-alcohol dehydrogenase-like predicted oxidoreductase